MADTFFNPIDIAITDSNANPPTGFARLQVKNNGKLHVKAMGNEVVIEPTVVTKLIVDGGNANTVPENFVLRFDFGGAT
jgi:predicted transcriptional regulator